MKCFVLLLSFRLIIIIIIMLFFITNSLFRNAFSASQFSTFFLPNLPSPLPIFFLLPSQYSPFSIFSLPPSQYSPFSLLNLLPSPFSIFSLLSSQYSPFSIFSLVLLPSLLFRSSLQLGMISGGCNFTVFCSINCFL